MTKDTKKSLPLPPVKFPNRVHLDLTREPDDPRTPGLDRVFKLDPGAGKGEPPKASKTLFRGK